MTWKPFKEKDEEVTPLKFGLEKLANRLGASGMTEFHQVTELWVECVGQQVSEHATPIAVKHRELVVEVDDSRWATQMKWLSPQVVVKLNASLGVEVIDAVKVQLKRSSQPR